MFFQRPQVEIDIDPADENTEPSLARQVAAGVGGELRAFGSGLLREACGVTGVMPMNKTQYVGHWGAPGKRWSTHRRGRKRSRW